MLAARLRSRSAAILLLLLSSSSLASQDWSRFRGPNGSGVSASATIPTAFAGDGALLWSAEVPFGRSSPAVTDDRIFLTAVGQERLMTLAVARSSGEILWQRGMERKRVDEFHSATDSATPSPVTDGENVYAFFQEGGLVSYDGEGQERWRLSLGPFRNFYGMAASPILVGNLVVVLCDQAGGSFLLAVDRDSGQEVWRQSRAARRESYTTPLLYPSPSDPRLILVSGSKHLDAYDPQSGESVWTVSGLGAGPVASPVVAGDRVYVVAPNHSESPLESFTSLLEQHDGDDDARLTPEEVEGDWKADHFGFLDFDGDGRLSAEDWSSLGQELTAEGWGLYAIGIGGGEDPPEIAWNYRQNASYIPTPLVYDGIVYMIKDSILTSIDAENGNLLKRGRVGAAKVYASPIAADGRLLISNIEGKLFVLEAGEDWRILDTHDLEEEVFAAPAIAGNELYVRTRGRLLAFAAQKEADTAP